MEAFDKFISPSGDAEAKEKLESMRQWSQDFDHEYNGSANYMESINTLEAHSLIDAETVDLAVRLFKKSGEGYGLDMDGSQLGFEGFDNGMNAVNQAINWWIFRTTNNDIENPKDALRDMADRWKLVVAPKIEALKALLKRALKIQAYCSDKGFKKIRTAISNKYGLGRLNNENLKFSVFGIVVDIEALGKFRVKLEQDLYDLLNPNSITDEFIESLPALTADRELDLPGILDKDPFVGLIDKLPKDIGIILKKYSKEQGSEVNVVETSSGLPAEFGTAANDKKDPLSFHFELAKKYLRDSNSGLSLDDENKIIRDRDGDILFQPGIPGINEGYREVAIAMSKIIKEVGYDTAMKALGSDLYNKYHKYGTPEDLPDGMLKLYRDIEDRFGESPLLKH